MGESQQDQKDPVMSRRIPASDNDRLSTAVEQERESSHSKSSQNAEAAWDAVPGEEIAVDFKDAGYEEIDKEAQAEHGLFDAPPPGGDLYPIAEVRALKRAEDVVWGQASGPTLVGALASSPELSVDVYVNLPDGRSWNMNLAIPEGEEKLTAEALLEAVADHFDSVEVFLQSAITPARRAALGLMGLGPGAGTRRPVKDDPQA